MDKNAPLIANIFSELYKIMVNKIAFVGFRGGGAIGAISPPWSGLLLHYNNNALFGIEI